MRPGLLLRYGSAWTRQRTLVTLAPPAPDHKAWMPRSCRSSDVDVASMSYPRSLGQPYTVHGYPKGDNAATGLPWTPATDGLRNITGRVNRDGTATIWAVTS